jgi:hypothetical protein
MTTQASIDAAVYQVTEWALPRSRIQNKPTHCLTVNVHDLLVRREIPSDPQSDSIDYELHLQIEVDRWKDKCTEAWVQRGEDGMIAMFTWAGKQLPVEGEDAKE